MRNDEKELLKLYRDRIRDRAQAKTKRRKQTEAGPQKLSTLLQGYFKKDGEALRRIEETKAILAWETLVGSAGARFSQALKVRNATLIVKVPDPLWMQQLCLLKHELLKKYQTQFPQLRLRDIYFTRA